jgi:hypothetical protein
MAAKDSNSQSAFEKLEAATGSLQKEREFFDALMKAGSAAEVTNRIIHLVTLHQTVTAQLPEYLLRRAANLFNYAPPFTASILASLLSEITRSARLTAYLCVKGVVPQAIAAMRAAVEQIGVYTHIWHEPYKGKYLTDSDSNDYARAFRYPANEARKKQLKAQGIQYRFMYCKGAEPLSEIYRLLSAHFIHGFGAIPQKAEELSYEFVDRATPQDLEWQYKLAQMLLSLVYTEILGCIPREDWLEGDIATLTTLSAIFLPTLAFSLDNQDPDLAKKVDQLFDALANVKWGLSE